MKKVLGKSLTLVAGLYLSACGQNETSSGPSHLKEAPDSLNNPYILGIPSKAYSEIRAQANISSKPPWSGYYWPNSKLGIAARWQNGHPKVNPHAYRIPSIQEILSMDPASRNRLSPAEKYDLISGRGDLPLANGELATNISYWNSNGGNIPDWFGICDGWAIASVLMHEPR